MNAGDAVRLVEIRRLARLQEEATIQHLALCIMLRQAIRMGDVPLEELRRLNLAGERSFNRAMRRGQQLLRFLNTPKRLAS